MRRAVWLMIALLVILLSAAARSQFYEHGRGLLAIAWKATQRSSW